MSTASSLGLTGILFFILECILSIVGIDSRSRGRSIAVLVAWICLAVSSISFLASIWAHQLF